MLEFTFVAGWCFRYARSVEEAHLSQRRSPCKHNPELPFTTGPRHFSFTVAASSAPLSQQT